MPSLTLDDVLRSPKLPSLPKVAIEVLELTRDPDVDVNEIARVVQYDQALSGKILKTVNSSFYGLSKPCPTISRAVTYLGLNTVTSLVLGFSLVDLTRRDSQGLDMLEYWRRCIHSAGAARLIAKRCGGCDPEEAFIAALMQDIGMLCILPAAQRSYQELLQSCRSGHRELVAVERASLGFTHADAGARLGKKWKLPEQLVEAIRHHHTDTPPVSRDHAALIKTVCLSYLMAELIVEDGASSRIEGVLNTARQSFELREPDVRALLREAADDARALASFLTVSIGDGVNVDEVLERAEEARLIHSMNLQREAETLRDSYQELEKQALTDALTHVANRKRFDDSIQEQFRSAAASGGCVGLIIADVDRFKSFNDTYGHQAGDRVLVELARRMRDATGNAGLACRYGGEEFAIIVPDADRRVVGGVAERVRRAIEASPFELGDAAVGVGTVAVTASFGVAALEPETRQTFSAPDQLISAADRALYAAKEAGRNCVRIYRARAGRGDSAAA
jgi:two-component system cell cycle response regulator